VRSDLLVDAVFFFYFRVPHLDISKFKPEVVVRATRITVDERVCFNNSLDAMVDEVVIRINMLLYQTTEPEEGRD
jgi:hypothetical protein